MDGNHPKNPDTRPKRRKDQDNPYEIFTTGSNTSCPHFYLSFKDSMACIYGAYEMTNRATPMGILQHTVHEKLLQEYCHDLKKELEERLSNI